MDDVGCWTILSEDYIGIAVNNMKEILKWKMYYKLYKGQKTPMTGNYVPEFDGTPELDAEETTLLQELIGVLRWATELGRVDILHKVAILSQYNGLTYYMRLQSCHNTKRHLGKDTWNRSSIYFPSSMVGQS